MTTDPTCLNLTFDRPTYVPAARWVDAWTNACCQRLLPDLRTYSIDHDRCHLSVDQHDGRADFDLFANLEAVASVYAKWAERPVIDLAPRPRELVDSDVAPARSMADAIQAA